MLTKKFHSIFPVWKQL